MSFHEGAAILLLVIALMWDVRVMRIPNWLTVTACMAGWLYHWIAGGAAGLGSTLAGTAAGLVPLLILYLLQGIGAGDVKLFAALGAWIGAVLVFQVFIYSILFAGGIGLVIIIINRPLLQRFAALLKGLLIPGANLIDGMGTVKGKRLRFPFMLAVAPGAWAAWIFSSY